MNSLLEYLDQNYVGIIILLLIIFAVIAAMNWLAHIFRWGRYDREATDNEHLRGVAYVISVFFTNLINDFKHLLALVIVVVFTGLIFYSMAAGTEFDQKLEALQLVIASLGGLLGSIIGYYFGESAARGATNAVVNYNNPAPDNQGIQPTETEIEAAPDFNLGEVEN